MKKIEPYRLVAIFIPKKVLTHVLGRNHAGQTLNLGGKYLYTFTEKNEKLSLSEKKPNPAFIAGFWGEQISLASAIVGENGTGKTSILNIFRNTASFCRFIYETEDGEDFLFGDDANFHEVIYYSAFMNIFLSGAENTNFRDLSKYHFMLDDTQFESTDMEELLNIHSSENLKRWIHFIELQQQGKWLEQITLPSFDRIQLKIISVSADDHQTPMDFRPFFKALEEKLEAERVAREDAELKRLNLKSAKEIRATNKIRLELEILRRIITKTKHILEQAGNKYLKEGFLNQNYTVNSKVFTDFKSTKDAFFWFLENAYISFSNKRNRIFLPVKEIKDLVEVLLGNLPEAKDIEDWTELTVDFDGAKEILKVYRIYLLSFRDDFAFDKKSLLAFRPYVNLSSGEKGMYDLFSALSDFEQRVVDGVHENFSQYSKRTAVSNSLLILLDEGDLGFHPEWKKKFIDSLTHILPLIFKGRQIQLIITTHDPLTLSDFPRQNIICLKRKGDLSVLDTNMEIPSFGANVSDLLKHSFFLSQGLIGDFAKKKIEDVINRLNKWLAIKENGEVINLEKVDPKEIAEIKKVIEIIDEPIVQHKLIEMYNYIFEDPAPVDQEILRLEKMLEELKASKKNAK